MTILSVRHVTTYSYAAPVRLGEHRMMLRPRDSNDQRLLKASLGIMPQPHRLRWIHD
ncbi:MAG: transglutaminase family protein, partial [Hyphomicrobiales bacterium]|nr:transglutaminase family protein [Hyphomicrobiales bacterium]